MQHKPFNELTEHAIHTDAAIFMIAEVLALYFPEIKSWVIYSPMVDWDALDSALFQAWRTADIFGRDSDLVRGHVADAVRAIWQRPPPTA